MTLGVNRRQSAMMGYFFPVMTTDSWCQAGYAFQFVSGSNNNYNMQVLITLKYELSSDIPAIRQQTQQERVDRIFAFVDS